MNKIDREIRRMAHPLGWRVERVTGTGHLRLRHTSGAIYVVGRTPSDNRTIWNIRAHLRRLGRVQ